MPSFTDPAHRQVAARLSVAKRRDWRDLKRQLKGGEVSFEYAVTRPCTRGRTLAEVLGFCFGDGRWKGGPPTPNIRRAITFCNRFQFPSSCEVQRLSPRTVKHIAIRLEQTHDATPRALVELVA